MRIPRAWTVRASAVRKFFRWVTRVPGPAHVTAGGLHAALSGVVFAPIR